MEQLWEKKVEYQGIKGGCSLENIQLPLADDPVVTLGSVTDFPECKAVAESSTSVLWSSYGDFCNFKKVEHQGRV